MMRKRRFLESTINPTLDSRERLTAYLLSVIENARVSAARRDDAAATLARVLASPQPRAPRPPFVRPPPKVRVGKKAKAETASMTATKGTAWDGLVNGSPRRPRRLN